tara:strand:+ start:295 stop:465 length:171 start_codon:yes stop_codon:yes gene_type:complete
MKDTKAFLSKLRVSLIQFGVIVIITKIIAWIIGKYFQKKMADIPEHQNEVLTVSYF